MYFQPKGFFDKILEAIIIGIIIIILLKVGIYLIGDVIGWVIAIPLIVIGIRIAWSIYKHHKDTHDF